jgi:aminopeptidase N
MLTINSVTVTVSPDSSTNPPTPGVASWQLEAAADFLHITVLNTLEVGAKYNVTIIYSGFLTSDGNGIYYDSYVELDGTTKYIMATQLEEISARNMYPCFDEPDLKATFRVTAAHLPAHTALSNMPIIRTESRPNGYIADVYDVSPIMSTYHVCVPLENLPISSRTGRVLQTIRFESTLDQVSSAR